MVDASFFTLGGDSLVATRVVRGLYAVHHGVLDSRNLGGSAGTLGGAWSVNHLLRSSTLGGYVDFLSSAIESQTDQRAGEGCETAHGWRAKEESAHSHRSDADEIDPGAENPLYGNLILSITLGHFTVAGALLDLGVDPNSQQSRGRMGKVTDRKQQRSLFKSNPLHLACSRGNPRLVKKLLSRGQFPLDCIISFFLQLFSLVADRKN